jgi:ABC-2 type transport system permease protein
MQAVGRFLPPSYVFEGLRSVVRGQPASAGALVLSACLAVVYIAAAAWFFQAVYRHAVRTGLIARYSAESLS